MFLSSALVALANGMRFEVRQFFLNEFDLSRSWLVVDKVTIYAGAEFFATSGTKSSGSGRFECASHPLVFLLRVDVQMIDGCCGRFARQFSPRFVCPSPSPFRLAIRALGLRVQVT